MFRVTIVLLMIVVVVIITAGMVTSFVASIMVAVPLILMLFVEMTP